MAKYKDENGTTRVGDLLRGLGDVGKPILSAAGSLTGQPWLTAIAKGIKTSSEIKEDQKTLALELLRMDVDDVANAREHDARVQESENASWLAKNVGYIIDISLILLLFGIVVALFIKTIPVENENTLYMVLGMVLGFVGAVITFHRGSSQGSKEKTRGLIDKIKK
jgi:hypothetical protein